MQGDVPAKSEAAQSEAAALQDAMQAVEPEAKLPAVANSEALAGSKSEAHAGAESEDPAAAAAVDNPPEVVILKEYTTTKLAQIRVPKKN